MITLPTPTHAIALISHARAPDPYNTGTITFNAGKPKTVVEGEAEGLRMRRPMETVHYREDEANPICAQCGRLAEVWHGMVERWEVHPMRCQWVGNTTNSSPEPGTVNALRRWWRR